MTDERFSYIVEDYFRQRGTHPAVLSFKNAQVDDQFLLELDEAVHETFDPRDDIELIESCLFEGDYWSGVLLEFNQDEFASVDASEWGAQTLVRELMDLYDEFAEFETRITGVSTGSSAWAVAALEALGKDYFKTATDVYNSGSSV